jgi:nicotinate-nucleotide--dimethylbenzimidazole phosphoribosyltransferase
MSIEKTIFEIQPLDEVAMQAARERQNVLTKPAGSLGRLEELSIQLAGITGKNIPTINDKVIITMAGDHGVVAEKISAYPQEVTPQMVLNFLAGGAAINVLAHHVGAQVVVVDMGVANDACSGGGIRSKRNRSCFGRNRSRRRHHRYRRYGHWQYDSVCGDRVRVDE